MGLLLIFAFLAGIVTILSPCILPILPIVLSSSLTGGKRRPYGIILGFIFSFTFFTLALTAIVKATNIPPDALRTIAIVVIFLFGASLLIPQTQLLLEKMMTKFSSLTPNTANKNGFTGGLVIGLSLGLLWAPCVGPILASVITLALTSQVTSTAVFITLAYSVGTAIPMFAIIQGGRQLLQKVPWLLSHSAQIQKAFGVVMIFMALALVLNLDRKFQTYILTAFPQYGAGLTGIENTPAVQSELQKLKGGSGTIAAPEGLTASGPQAPDFTGGQMWFNSQPLSISQLKGKVVLVDFWTYSCVNCIRTLPYLKAWYNQYKDQGFVIVGVHSPEFEFEKDATNVGKAIKDFGITYPVVQDNDLNIWNAYNNEYWPADYLVDKNGEIRYTAFGEGDYDKTEAAIRSLLAEAGDASVSAEPMASPVAAETPNNNISPETYIGLARQDRLITSPMPTNTGTQTYQSAKVLDTDTWTLGGSWNMDNEFATATTGSTLDFEFSAQRVFLVMAPGQSMSQVKVFVDDQPIPAAISGADVKNGIVTLDSDRLYDLVKLPGVTTHKLHLEFQTPGTQVYAFTFG